MSQSSSESDIWDYRPLRKINKRPKPAPSGQHEGKRRKEAEQGTTKEKAGRSTRQQRVGERKDTVDFNRTTRSSSRKQLPSEALSSSAPPASPGLKETPAAVTDPEKGLTAGGYCPVCQMPFSVLVVQSQRWHVSECLDTPGESVKECPDGLLCSSTIPNHYKRYSHSLLAHSRACISTDCSALQLGPTARSQLEQNLLHNDVSISSKETSVDSAVNLSSVSSQSVSPGHGSKEPQTPVCTNALLLLRSPAPEDIKKKKGWSPCAKGPTSHTGSHEATTRISTPVKAGSICHVVQTEEIKEEFSAVNYEDDISYSPLSEEVTQTKRKLFHSTALEGVEEEDDNDSLKLFDDTVSDDDLFSDHLDQYETEKTKSQEDLVLMESLYTCDQLKTLDHHEDLTSSKPAGAAEGPCHFSSPITHLKNKYLVKDCEGSTVKPLLRSPESLVLERLRECISNPADCNILSSSLEDKNTVSVKQEMSSTQVAMPVTQSKSFSVTPRKAQTNVSGLKQTDIGVFFGLKPLTKKTGAEVNAASEKNSAPGKSLIPAGKIAKQQGRQRRKATAVSEESTAMEAAEEGFAQPTQTEGGRGVRAGGRKRWNRGRTTDGGPEEPKRCPFYKKIPGTGFVVDAFQYGTIEGITAYFLTHFHSDHYGGLTKKSSLPIYCNKITGNLVKSKLKVDERYVHILPMNTECTVDGVKVILLDANHCPGSAMLLFLLPDGQTVLHTGDFRADPSMERYPELQLLRIQTLYLDTTYCNPEYTFPTQQEVITFAANTAFELVTLNPRTLVVCGTYAVGKEKVFLAISQVLGSKVYMSRDRYNTMCCLESEVVRQCITTDQNAAQVHVLPMMQLNFKNLKTYFNKLSDTYDQLVAFKPTGWTFTQSEGVENIQAQVNENISIYGIPYSEHSSFLELKRFVQWLRPLKIIPTVNVGSWNSRKAMEQCFREWQSEVKAPNTVSWNSCSKTYTRQ